MKQLFLSLIALLIIQSSYSQAEPVLKIGLVADPQYADKPTAGKRYYRESLWKLKEAIVTFSDNNVDLIQNLGGFCGMHPPHLFAAQSQNDEFRDFHSGRFGHGPGPYVICGGNAFFDVF